jgi:hypothetical protein
MKNKLMLLAIVFITAYQVRAQAKIEIREFQGTLQNFEVGYRFAYEYLTLKVESEEYRFYFPPFHGQWIQSKFKPGDLVKVKVSYNYTLAENVKKLKAEKSKYATFLDRQVIVDIWADGQWVSLPDRSTENLNENISYHFDKKIKSFYTVSNLMKAIIFEDNSIAYTFVYHKERDPSYIYKVGDRINFLGIKPERTEGYAYPFPEKKVYEFFSLVEIEGTIKSYLYKQNAVCIGAKFYVDNNELTVCFPSEKAEEVKNFLIGTTQVTLYTSADKQDLKSNLFPELHVLIKDKDTLKINQLDFFGGPDRNHKFKSIEFEGKISRITKSQSGKVANLIIDEKYFVEIDPRLDAQIGTSLKKGIVLKIKGKERLKKEGEVYRYTYRIISPEQIVIEGKTHLLNNLP